MNQYNELVQNSTSVVNTLIYLLKSLEQSEKKNQNVILNSIDNLTATFSVNNIESNVNSILNNIKKTVDDYIFLNKSLIKPFPALDNGSKNNDIIYNALQEEYKKIKRLESISNKQFSATKSIVTRPVDHANVKILTDCHFELYCKISVELNKSPINSTYQRIKTIWENKYPEFFTIFSKVKPGSWGSIGNPMELGPTGLTPRTIPFNDDWLKPDKIVEKNAMDLISSDLGKLFNKLFCLYDSEFRSTLLAEYYPFVTDEPIGNKKMIKLFQEKYSDQLVEARGGYKSDQLIFTDRAVFMAKGNQIKISCYDCDCDTSESENDELDDENIFSEASSMQRNKKVIKRPVKKVKPSIEKTVYRHTNADINKLISNVQTALSNTAKNFQNIVENISSFYHSLDRQASQLYSKTNNAPKILFKNDVEIIIGRCNTLLKDNQASVHVEKIRSYFTNILKRIVEIQNKSKYREAYINTQQYPELCKFYCEILDIVDNKSTEFTKLVIIKENNYNNTTKKIEENNGEIFKYDSENKKLIVKFKLADQSKFVDDKYSAQLFVLEKQFEFASKIIKYLDELNKNFDRYSKFATWFKGDIVLNIKRKFLEFRNLKINKINDKYLHPDLDSGITNNNYLNKVFNTKDFLNSNKISITWPDDDNYDNFNEMLRGYYGQLFFLDYSINEEYNNVLNMNPSLRDDRVTKKVFPSMIYPTCYTLECNYVSSKDLYHQHRVINQVSKAKLKPTIPALANFVLNIGDFDSLDMATILLLQYFREKLHFKNDRFDLKPFEDEMESIKIRQEEINTQKERVYSIPCDLYVPHNMSMDKILCYTNVDRNMSKNSNTLITIMGSSGSGKTFTLNGDNKENKGFYELFTSDESGLLEPANFEFLHVAMPYSESFEDSTNENLVIPRIWRYNIDPSNISNITSVPLNKFEFGSKVNIQTYNNNYSKKNGIRDMIEKIRKTENMSEDRPYSTIRSTPNNPESSRSTYIQAIKIKDSYHLVLDRPGEEDPYSTFKIDSEYDMACYSNPIFAVASYLSNAMFREYPIAVNESSIKLFNAICFTNFKSNTLLEHLTKILDGVKQEPTTTELFPHTNFKSPYLVEDQVKTEYVRKRLLCDLDDFTKANEKKLESFVKDLDSRFNELPKSVYEYIKNIHKNEEWLNFKINVDNFQEYGFFTNMYINGMASNQIAIKDLFPMHAYKLLFEKHKQSNSIFFDFFFKDNFSNQLCCPLLGWLLREFSNMLKLQLSEEYNGYKSGMVVNDFYLITQSGVNIKTGDYDELKFCDFSVNNSSSRYLDADTQTQLGFEHFMGLCKYGNQSFINSWSSISSFLVSTRSISPFSKTQTMSTIMIKK